MTWEQKLAALDAIAETSLRMRKPGDWYVEARGRYVVGNGIEVARYGNGKTPQEAVENDWLQLVEGLPSDRHIRIRGGKEVRWNGYMWTEASK